MVKVLQGTFVSAIFAKRASSGYYMGQASNPESVSNGTTTSAYVYKYPVDVQALGLTYATRTGKGGGSVWTTKVSGVSAVNNSPMNLSALDTDLEALFTSSAVDTTTNSNYSTIVRNTNNKTLQPFGGIFHIQLDYDDGSSKWLNLVKLNVQVTKTTGSTFGFGEGENPSPLAYELVHAQSAKNIFGQNFASANARPTNDLEYEMVIIGDYRLGLTTYVDDGSATSYILGHRPSTSTKAQHFIFKNGTENSTNVSTINTTTGSVAITAGTAGQVWHHLYPTEFVAI